MPEARRAAGGSGSHAGRTANPDPAAAGTLESLQAARGIAAVLVVLYHCSTGIFGLAKYAPLDPFHRAFAGGRFGVELFFVISGFIILSTHRHDVSRPRRLGSFVRKRFLRIYPIYWLVLASLLAAYAAMPRLGDGSELRPLTILSSLTLVHVGTPSMVLGVSWTLCFEILFYALFATLILDRRLGIAVLAVWWGLAALRVVSGSSLLAAYPFSDYTLLFPLGMAVSFACQRGLVARPLALALCGAAIFVANGLGNTYAAFPGRVGAHLVSGVSSAMLLAGFASLERRGRLRVPRLLVFLGDASYSIYLIHFTVLSLLARILLPRALAVIPAAAVAWLLILMSIAAGAALHVVMERPLRSILAGRRRPAGLASEARQMPLPGTWSRNAA